MENIDLTTSIMTAVATLIAIIAIGYWYKLAQSPQRIQTVESMPPWATHRVFRNDKDQEGKPCTLGSQFPNGSYLVRVGTRRVPVRKKPKYIQAVLS